MTSLATALLCGALLVGLDSRPRSVVVAMPALLEQIWAVGLIVTGLAGLAGIGWRGHFATGLGVELGALLGLGAVTGMYAIALFVVSGAGALAAGLFLTAVAVASWWRCLQIARFLYHLARLDLRSDGVEGRRPDSVEVPIPTEGGSDDRLGAS
ncbi:hypothetical protein ACN27G_17565 [Plantactinospora sp. WMMB334]|uniref:hypothetical protein n=1 Tax=Plantactinospora sp. WMMB334 TaxID=3404119 RepID=UPI003B9234F6